VLFSRHALANYRGLELVQQRVIRVVRHVYVPLTTAVRTRRVVEPLPVGRDIFLEQRTLSGVLGTAYAFLREQRLVFTVQMDALLFEQRVRVVDVILRRVA